MILRARGKRARGKVNVCCEGQKALAKRDTAAALVILTDYGKIGDLEYDVLLAIQRTGGGHL